MEEIKLDVQVRDRVGTRKIRAVRREDCVPAIVYGDSQKPTAIKVDRRKYEKVVRHHRGENLLFHLNVLDGEKSIKDYAAIVKEEQLHPVSDKIVHIDFFRINLNKEIEVKVKIVAKGEPIGVKQDGGSLEHILWELDVVCLPTKIPQKIEIEVSHLKIGDAVHVHEIKLPEGVHTKHDPESVLITVVAPMKEEAAPVEGAPVEVEVTKEKKPKEGEVAAAPKAEDKAKEKPAK
jgi:large subunit ribosomal protein L25